MNATDRNLSITVKNDSADFEKKMSPLSKIAVDRLQEIGYQVQNIHFTHLTNPSADTIEKKIIKDLPALMISYKRKELTYKYEHDKIL
ncbi:hypothetical protein AAHH67_06765 [Niallia circulans]